MAHWSDIFIEPAELNNLLEKKHLPLKIFDCRFELAIGDKPAKGVEFFNEGHIPDAQYLDLEKDLSALTTPTSSRHPMVTQQQFNQICEHFNLTQETPIVFYDQGKLAFAARAWFVFQLFGFNKVRILSGGWRSWKKLHSEVNRAHHKKDHFNFTSVKLPISVCHLDDALNSSALIDAREAIRFRGEHEPIDPIAGHIPGAENLPWLENFDSNENFHSIAWHKNRWQSRKNLTPVHYCGSGVTAIVNLISGLLGTPQKQILYSGGWSEYIYSENFLKYSKNR
ncbi:sulfurtransferase [Pleionea sediminis]|uniref:sulfurtransferase n=1 Tax=Pleionea sediminis TaxID=2569479 RepID=UPI0011863B84|nr:rhodanese-like domain-containing protein [Pleionea sediminis]